MSSCIKTFFNFILIITYNDMIVIFLPLIKYMFFQKKNFKGTKDTKTAWELFKLLFKLMLSDKAALLVVPLTMKTGFLNGFVFGQFTRAWIGCSIG